MQIQHKNDGSHGEFFIENNGAPLAEMTYSMMDEKTMLISHTGVDPKMRGQGIAMQLVEEAVKYARQHDMKIVPQCSYVRKAFETHTEMKDVMK